MIQKKASSKPTEIKKFNIKLRLFAGQARKFDHYVSTEEIINAIAEDDIKYYYSGVGDEYHVHQGIITGMYNRELELVSEITTFDQQTFETMNSGPQPSRDPRPKKPKN